MIAYIKKYSHVAGINHISYIPDWAIRRRNSSTGAKHVYPNDLTVALNLYFLGIYSLVLGFVILFSPLQNVIQVVDSRGIKFSTYMYILCEHNPKSNRQFRVTGRIGGV